MKRLFFFLFCVIIVICQTDSFKHEADKLTDEMTDRVIEWRRHFHKSPELSNQEYKTAKKIAEILNDIGLEVKTGIANTGVVALLKTNRPGPVVALRADIDGLPVTERTNLPYASNVKTDYNGEQVGVMHACGHDTHIAMLLGAAQILHSMKDQLKGTIKFIFQPAEEGAPVGVEAGAKLMVKEGVLTNPLVDAIFGIHIYASLEIGYIYTRPKGLMAAANSFTIKVLGRQAHGSAPWSGVDPIVTAAQIINGLQTIVSRSSQLTKAAAVITVGSIHGGNRSNIIPEEVTMVGTIRTLDQKMQEIIFKRINETATKIAESMGATAEVTIDEGYPITYNDPSLFEQMLPSLERVAGQSNIVLGDAMTGAEDFSFFQKEVPGLYFGVGGLSPGKDPSAIGGQHHTPDFVIDEKGMNLGVKAFIHLTVDYLNK